MIPSIGCGPGPMTIEAVADAVRSGAEVLAKRLGLDPDSLWLMCGTVSVVLVDMLRAHGHRARLVVGDFIDETDEYGHFWVEVGARSASTLVDLTARQFDESWPRVTLLEHAANRRASWRARSTGRRAY